MTSGYKLFSLCFLMFHITELAFSSILRLLHHLSKGRISRQHPALNCFWYSRSSSQQRASEWMGETSPRTGQWCQCEFSSWLNLVCWTAFQVYAKQWGVLGANAIFSDTFPGSWKVLGTCQQFWGGGGVGGEEHQVKGEVRMTLEKR